MIAEDCALSKFGCRSAAQLAPIVARGGRTAAVRVNEVVVWTARVAAVLLMLLVDAGLRVVLAVSQHGPTTPHSDSITHIFVIPCFSSLIGKKKLRRK